MTAIEIAVLAIFVPPMLLFSFLFIYLACALESADRAKRK